MPKAAHHLVLLEQAACRNASALSIALDPVSCCLVVRILVCQVLLCYAAYQGIICSTEAGTQTRLSQSA